ncbi:MAG TPA: hypothetical protein PKV72_01605 [Candidatus Peribacteria bacterium]|nr:hypothetical protein [Candidatus Peribacteria bacterium]
MTKLFLPGQPSRNDALLDLDAGQLDVLSRRQMLIRQDHRGFAEFPVDPTRPDLKIGGSVVAFNPEVKHDEAVGLKMVSVGEDGARTGIDLQTDTADLVAHFEDGQPFGMYLFAPTPDTAGTSKRIDETCFDGTRMLQVRGIRRRSLVCAVRIGEQPIASDLTGEIPVPLMLQPKGFPRTYLQSTKRQTPGIMVPGRGGAFEQTVNLQSEPLVFGERVADGTALTVAVLEYIEHDELETGPVDLRPKIVNVLRGSVELDSRPVAPADLATFQAPQKRLLTAMRIMLRKRPANEPGEPRVSV